MTMHLSEITIYQELMLACAAFACEVEEVANRALISVELPSRSQNHQHHLVPPLT